MKFRKRFYTSAGEFAGDGITFCTGYPVGSGVIEIACVVMHNKVRC
jgi:hypothetical protein